MHELVMDAWIGLGSNQGDRLFYLSRALWELSTIGSLRLASSIYETTPWGVKEQPAFYNAVVCIQTNLEPLELLGRLHRIEEQAGRQRDIPNGPRTLDLDLLIMGGILMQTEFLTLPHPRLTERDFVLAPLVEIAPLLKHPEVNLDMQTLLPKASIKTLSGNILGWDGKPVERVV
ncbi:MAG: 2-amino-4-hydroxy-6-hydroxymethyldihydropteridine diphosphokinase [Candidatus Cloacimonetes bacterium]|nr:2-amino-4-hydroxy-6-hydroxymethyldihydropteridine diphosphokinase [Candidatus Cloacimonadota bacterium]